MNKIIAFCMCLTFLAISICGCSSPDKSDKENLSVSEDIISLPVVSDESEKEEKQGAKEIYTDAIKFFKDDGAVFPQEEYGVNFEIWGHEKPYYYSIGKKAEEYINHFDNKISTFTVDGVDISLKKLQTHLFYDNGYKIIGETDYCVTYHTASGGVGVEEVVSILKPFALDEKKDGRDVDNTLVGDPTEVLILETFLTDNKELDAVTDAIGLDRVTSEIEKPNPNAVMASHQKFAATLKISEGPKHDIFAQNKGIEFGSVKIDRTIELKTYSKTSALFDIENFGHGDPLFTVTLIDEKEATSEEFDKLKDCTELKDENGVVTAYGKEEKDVYEVFVKNGKGFWEINAMGLKPEGGKAPIEVLSKSFKGII